MGYNQIQLYIEDILAGEGRASSKKEAQQLAAEVACRKLSPNNPLMKEIKEKKERQALQLECEDDVDLQEEKDT